MPADRHGAPLRRRRWVAAASASALPLGWALAQPVAPAPATLQLRVHWMVTGGVHRDAVLRLLTDFSRTHPHIKLSSRELDQAPYKDSMLATLRAQPAGADVLAWFAGERLRELARQGLLEPLDAMAETGGWTGAFKPALRAEASWEGQLYGLPMATYVWGFFYRRSLFSSWGLTPPRTWPELLDLCAALRQRQVAPFVVGAKDDWALAGWFDQLNLRLHGRSFHLAVLRGQVPFTDARVRATFEQWRDLIQQGAFIDKSPELSWRAAVPYVSRGLAGMMLTGGFAASQFPAGIRQDLGWFPFPAARPAHTSLQVAPLDVLVVPRRAANKAAAAAFLAYAADAQVQQRFNAALGTLPPHARAPAPNDRETWLQSSAQALESASGLTQFFDRDATSAFSGEAMALLQRFFRQPADLGAVLRDLEALRQRLGEAPREKVPATQPTDGSRG
jgi:multiple sugar transport system substrate-binding protein